MIIYLKELWQYRKIIYQLVLLAFKTEFRQSLIGPIWHIIQPLISSGVLLVVFKEILGTAESLENPYLTFFSAIIFWNIFLQSFTSSALVFESNKGIFPLSLHTQYTHRIKTQNHNIKSIIICQT